MSYIDLHAHVLPGVDDGAETLEASLMMLRYGIRAWHESFSRHAARSGGDEDAVFGKI